MDLWLGCWLTAGHHGVKRGLAGSYCRLRFPGACTHRLQGGRKRLCVGVYRCAKDQHSMRLPSFPATSEDRLSEHQIRGWNAVSAAGLLGQGSCKRNVVCYRHRYSD